MSVMELKVSAFAGSDNARTFLALMQQFSVTHIFLNN